MTAAGGFKNNATATNQQWQTDFNYLKVVGGVWFCVSTILDEFLRHVIAWKLCTTLKTGDVKRASEFAVKASGSMAPTSNIDHGCLPTTVRANLAFDRVSASAETQIQ